MPITEDDYQHLYFYARPPVEKSPLLYTWQDKFYHTHHEKDPTYTVTRMPKLRAEQMMKTYVYQQEWRMNGWVNQIKLDFSKYYLEEYYENGVFLYYIERPKQKESNEVEKKIY